MTRNLLTSGQLRMKRRSTMKEMGKSILSTLASTIDRLSVNVTDFEACGSKGKVRVSVIASTDIAKSDILSAINEKFEGKLRGVARSFRSIENSNSDRNNVHVTLEGFVVPNVEVISMASDAGKQMKCVASNMFLDPSDCIWSKTGDMLYKKSEVETSEELNKFLTECSSSTVRMRKSRGFEQIEVSSGSFISYMSSGEMCYGFVVAADDNNKKLMVLAEGEDDAEVIDTFDVQSEVPIDDEKVRFPEEEEFTETSASSVDVNALVNYYKRWLAYNKNYADQLISRLKGHSFC